MQMGGGVDVVHLEAVAGGGADQHCLRHAGAQVRTDHARLRIAAFLAHEVDQHPGPRQRDAEDAAAERIEHAALEPLHHVARQVLIPKAGCEGGELAGLASLRTEHGLSFRYDQDAATCSRRASSLLSASVSSFSIAFTSASCWRSGIVPRVSLRNLSTMSSADANECSLP